MLRITSIVALALSITACGTPDVNEGISPADVIAECTYTHGKIVESIENVMYWSKEQNATMVEVYEGRAKVHKERFNKYCKDVKL